MNVTRRRGQRKTVVAAALRPAVIMHRMMMDGTEFRWSKTEAPIAA